MPSALLTDRAIVSVSGPDAEHFLQNIITTDLDALPEGVARPGALLTPQGKILFDFLVSRSGDAALRLECRADIADDFIRRLTLYRLRAKVDIVKQDQSVVGVTWRNESADALSDSTASQTGSTARDPRFGAPLLVSRHYGPLPPETADAEAWRAVRVANGIAESGDDYGLGEAFPHDVLLDQTGGVGMRKGCYVGQEVVSRMQHRGTARRRVLIAEADHPLPGAGAEISAGGRAIGTLGSVTGSTALAIVRIDRAKEAMDAGIPILAGDVALRLSIPAWATFTFPQNAAAEEG